MRDLRKVKNRHSFELDNKQMVLVFAGLIIIGLLVFSAGVMVGSKAANDEFLLLAAKEDVRVKIKAPSLLDEKRLKEEAMSQIKVEDVTEKKPLDEKKAGIEVQSASASSREKALTPADSKESLPQPASVNKKERIDKTDQPDPKKKEAWFVQVASFQAAEDANKRAKELKDRGYKVVVLKADIPGKGAWHRVRLGPFDSAQDAKTLALQVEKKEKTSTFVTKGLTP